MLRRLSSFESICANRMRYEAGKLYIFSWAVHASKAQHALYKILASKEDHLQLVVLLPHCYMPTQLYYYLMLPHLSPQVPLA